MRANGLVCPAEPHCTVGIEGTRFWRGYLRLRPGRDANSAIASTGHIHAAIKDLNDKRPRPVLKGNTAREVFQRDRIAMPDRQAFIEEVRQAENHFVAQAASGEQQQTARRRAVEAVLLNHELMVISAPVTTDLSVGNLT